MTTVTSTKTAFFTYRTALGLVTGIAIWLIFAFFYNKPGDLTPHLSIILAMMVSNSFEPKHSAGLAASIGLITGVVWSLKQFLQNAGNSNLLEIIGMIIGLGIGIIYSVVIFTFLGFLFGNLVKLYKRRAIF